MTVETIESRSTAPLIVAVSGAAGQIGYALVPLLASGHFLPQGRRIFLRLLEIEPALPVLEGVAMELMDGAYDCLEDVQVTANAEEAFHSAHIIVLVGAFPRKKGMERSDLLQKNAAIFKQQGKAIDAHADRNVKIVVVGNPANTNALILSMSAPSIPKRNITALTRLDHNRVIGQIASTLHVPTSSVHGVCIWGNHSSTQYPDITKAYIRRRSSRQSVSPQASDISSCSDTGSIADGDDNRDLKSSQDIVAAFGGRKGVAEHLIPLIQKRGAAIIAARGASSAMSAANAIADHLHSWLCGDDQIVSMAVATDGTAYGIEPGLYFSFPVRCAGNGEYEIVDDYEIDDFSKKYIDATAAELYDERQEALDMLAKS